MSLLNHIIDHEILGVSSGHSGVGAVVIKDEGTIVGTFSTLNFTGNQIVALTGNNEAVIQCPPSTYAPYFSQAGAVIADVSTSSRLVAAPSSEGFPYKIGNWSPGSLKSCSNSGSITYTTSGVFSILDNTSSTTVQVLGADGIIVLAENSQVLTGNIDETLQNIRIRITDYSPDSDKFKARFSTTIDIGSILPAGGRYSIKMVQTNGADGTYTKTQSDIFYDANSVSPSMSDPVFSLNTANVVYLSGVRFFAIGTMFNVSLNDINNINNSSYPTTLINLVGSELGCATLNLNGANLSGWSIAYNNTHAYYNSNNYAIATTNFFNKGDLKVQARWNDWVSGAYQVSETIKALISTYINNGTRIYEDFRNESQRYLSNYDSLWNSTIRLQDIDAGSGLQVIDSKLIYPQENYTMYNPDTVNQPNYVGLSGIRDFKGRFYKEGVSYSNGVFKFGNHNITELKLSAKDIDILISLDKVNWYSATSDYLGGELLNSSGCRVESDVYNMSNNQIKFTLGTGKFTNLSSEWGIYYKIMYKDTASGKGTTIDSIEIMDWV
jgi:hypothetical protein